MHECVYKSICNGAMRLLQIFGNRFGAGAVNKAGAACSEMN